MYSIEYTLHDLVHAIAASGLEWRYALWMCPGFEFVALSLRSPFSQLLFSMAQITFKCLRKMTFSVIETFQFRLLATPTTPFDCHRQVILERAS